MPIEKPTATLSAEDNLKTLSYKMLSRISLKRNRHVPYTTPRQ